MMNYHNTSSRLQNLHVCTVEVYITSEAILINYYFSNSVVNLHSLEKKKDSLIRIVLIFNRSSVLPSEEFELTANSLGAHMKVTGSSVA